MNKKQYLLLLFVTQLFQAQEKGTVMGHILSEGQAIPFASILLKNTTTGSSSDENGNFSIQIPSGNQTIIVRAIGFKNQEKNINVPSGGKIHLDFNLEESVFGLNQVVVSATRGLQKRTEAPDMFRVVIGQV